MKRLWIPLLAVVAMGYASVRTYEWRWRRESDPPPAAPPVAPYKSTIAAVGLVEPSSENIAISTPVAGLVTQVCVKAGDRVLKGARLFTLDNRDLQAELLLRRTSVELSRKKLMRLDQSPRPEEVPLLEARVREAEAARTDVQNQLRLIESVSDKRAIREEDVLKRREAVNVAEAKLDEAKASLALLQAGTWSPDREITQAEFDNAEAQVRRVEADLERLTMRAPITGTILQLNVRAGEFAAVGQLQRPLLIMGDVIHLNIRTDVDENEAWRVKAGSPAEAAERGNSSRKAKVEFVRFEPYIVPKKSLTGDSTERVDTRVLQAIYRFKDPNVPFYVGQQMDVFIQGTSK